MLNMKPYVPSTKVAVRESSFDEDLSDDIEDEDVFIRDGKSIKVSGEKLCIRDTLFQMFTHMFCRRSDL